MFGSSLEYRSYNAEFLRGKGLIVTEHEDLGISIVRYHKSDNEWKTRTHGSCDREDPVVRNHRSVVYSLTTGLPLSVSPIRRVPNNAVGNSTFVENEDDFVVTEYLDGTMINVFWNPSVNTETGESYGWTLSSRSKIHATCRFTSDRLFRDLFDEARKYCRVNYESLNKQCCYSFMLTHPENRRVIPYDVPQIVLVSVTMCVPKVMRESGEGSTLVAKQFSWDNMVEEGSRIAPEILPKRVDISASNVLKHSMNDDVAKQLSGWMITHRRGSWDRVRILTDGFEECASLRGDSASLNTNYIRLMSLDPRGDAIRRYALWYPEETDAIKNLSNTIQTAITELLDNYVSRHVKKTKEHSDLPHWTRRPIWDLHGRYLRTRVPIKESEVFAYLRDISPSVVGRMLKNREKDNRRSTHSSAEVADAPESA